jgi:transposase
VIDGKGEVILEAKVTTRPEALRETFGGMPRSRIALETGTHSPWISRLLAELGHETIVAHARDVRLMGESRRKDDKIDARTLARLARIDAAHENGRDGAPAREEDGAASGERKSSYEPAKQADKSTRCLRRAKATDSKPHIGDGRW